MLTIGLVMFFLGALLAVAAFVFGLIGGHLGAMVVMAIGGLISSFGLILTIVALVMMFIPAK